MITVPAGVRIYLACGVTDNRRAKLKAAEFVQHFDTHRAKISVPAEAPCKPLADPLDLPRLSATLSHRHAVAVRQKELVDRAELFERAQANSTAFFKGEMRLLPDTDYWHQMVVADGERPLTATLAFCWWHWHGERIAALKSAMLGGDFTEHLVIIDQMLEAEVTKTQRVVLAKTIMQAEIEALTEIRKGDETGYAVVARAMPVDPTSKVVADTENPLLSVAAPKWMAEKIAAGKWKPRRADSCKQTIALFIAIVGDKRLSEYGKSDARDYKAVLCDLPPNYSKLPQTRDLAVRAAAKKARSLNLPKMSIVNVNKLLTIVSGMFDWLIGQYDGIEANPLANATIEISTNIREERDPFTLDELRTIFSAPIYVGCESERFWKKPGDLILRDTAKFWVPLLGLYTGARANELCKLKVSDVCTESGIVFIDINTEGHTDVEIDGGVKSTASVRHIPIHADLIAFGLMSFVDARQREGAERLFPELGTDKYGKLNDSFGKHFARFLKSLGIKRDQIAFHSFRHSWSDACLNSRIPDAVTSALKGESRPGTLARYGHGKTDIEILAEEMRKLVFKGLDLTHLRDPRRSTGTRLEAAE